MGLACGIVGLPNVGKTTIFGAITEQEVERSDYMFSTTGRQYITHEVFLDTPMQAYEEHFVCNVLAPLRMVKLAVPHMRAQGPWTRAT